MLRVLLALLDSGMCYLYPEAVHRTDFRHTYSVDEMPSGPWSPQWDGQNSYDPARFSLPQAAFQGIENLEDQGRYVL